MSFRGERATFSTLSTLFYLFHRMIEAAKMYPYFNEDAERNWEEGNANEEMIQEMIKITHCRVLDSVLEMDQYKVHGISFKKQQGTSLPIVDCFQHSTTKDK